MRGLSLVEASGGHSSSRCAGLSLSQPLLLRSTGSRRAGSATVAHGPSRSVACGIFTDQGSNLCPLHWQADSQPLRHQGSPLPGFYLTPSVQHIPYSEWLRTDSSGLSQFPALMPSRVGSVGMLFNLPCLSLLICREGIKVVPTS